MGTTSGEVHRYELEEKRVRDAKALEEASLILFDWWGPDAMKHVKALRGAAHALRRQNRKEAENGGN